MWKYGILGATLAFAAAVQPGPLLTYLIARTLSHGWRRTLPAAFAPCISDGPVIALVLLVLSHIPDRFQDFLRCAGGILLLFLAAAAFRHWRASPAALPEAPGSGRESLARATLVNLLNPGPYLGWSLVMGPLLLRGWREAHSHGIALIAGFYGSMTASLAGIILLFGATAGLGPRVSRSLVLASAVALAGLGAYELWTGVRALR